MLRLRSLRSATGKTQAEVADAVGISRAHLAKLETGGDAPGRDSLVALSDYYGVPIDYLEGRTPPAPSPHSGDLVNDPDELAWLNLWRGWTRDERARALQLLGTAREWKQLG